MGWLLGGEPAAVPACTADELVPNRLNPVPPVVLIDAIDKLPDEDIVDDVEFPEKARRVVGKTGVPLGVLVVGGGDRDALLEDDVVLVEEMLD